MKYVRNNHRVYYVQDHDECNAPGDTEVVVIERAKWDRILALWNITSTMESPSAWEELDNMMQEVE